MVASALLSAAVCLLLVAKAQSQDCAVELHRCVAASAALESQLMQMKSQAFFQCTSGMPACAQEWNNVHRCFDPTQAMAQSFQFQQMVDRCVNQPLVSNPVYQLLGSKSNFDVAIGDPMELAMIGLDFPDYIWGIRGESTSADGQQGCPNFDFALSLGASQLAGAVTGTRCRLSDAQRRCLQDRWQLDTRIRQAARQLSEARRVCIDGLRSRGLCLLRAPFNSVESCLCNARQRVQAELQQPLLTCASTGAPLAQSATRFNQPFGQPYLNYLPLQQQTLPYSYNSLSNPIYNQYYAPNQLTNSFPWQGQGYSWQGQLNQGFPMNPYPQNSFPYSYPQNTFANTYKGFDPFLASAGNRQQFGYASQLNQPIPAYWPQNYYTNTQPFVANPNLMGSGYANYNGYRTLGTFPFAGRSRKSTDNADSSGKMASDSKA